MECTVSISSIANSSSDSYVAPANRKMPTAFDVNSQEFGPVAATAIGVAAAATDAAGATVSFSSEGLKRLADLGNSAESAVEGVFTGIGNEISSLGHDVKDGVEKAYHAVENTFSSAVGSVEGAISSVEDSVSSGLSAVKSAIITPVEDSISSVASAVGDAASYVTDEVSAAASKAAGYISLGVSALT
jgi:phage-related protein